jgi:arginine exporter protein ArgO
MTSARHWQRLDILIGVIMLILSVKMLLAFPV